MGVIPIRKLFHREIVLVFLLLVTSTMTTLPGTILVLLVAAVLCQNPLRAEAHSMYSSMGLLVMVLPVVRRGTRWVL